MRVAPVVLVAVGLLVSTVPASSAASSQPAPPVLAAPTPSSAMSSAPTSYAAALGRPLSARRLGPSVGATVVDLGTGELAWSRGGARARTPASVTKLLTAAAALDRLGPEHVFTTRVVRTGVRGRVVLVGGGDPLLSAASGDLETGVPRTSLRRLARATLVAVRALPPAQRPRRLSVQVDDKLFAPPGPAPGWEPGYVGAGVAGAVGALSLDGGRAEPRGSARVADPGTHAGMVLAAQLRQLGMPAVARGRTLARTGAPVLASVTSAPLSRIVELMLDESDNDVAEVLGRQVAVSAGRPATARGAPAAVLATLPRLGVDRSGARLLDTSGLARGNLVEPGQLARVLAAAADPAHPQLGAVLSGLPVAGLTGTLADRFTGPADARARGLVRAKTGSLRGVAALAGTTVARDGRAYAFAFLADRVPGGLGPARDALDAAAAALARCGCRR